MAHTAEQRKDPTRVPIQIDVLLGALSGLGDDNTSAALADAMTRAQAFMPPEERITNLPISARTAGGLAAMAVDKGFVRCSHERQSPGVWLAGQRRWFLTEAGCARLGQV